MDMQKEQKEVDKMCEDLVDMHIEDLLKGKNDAVGISAALRSDLTRDKSLIDLGEDLLKVLLAHISIN